MSDITRRDLLKTSLPVIAGVSLGFGCGGASIPSTTVSAGPTTGIDMGVQQLAEYDVFLVRTEQGLAAISGQCTHAGCGVEPADAGGFHCGCHGSTFDADGSVTSGPANESLPWYEVRVEGGNVVVDPTRPVPQGTWTAI